jgi:hypothetical protein
MIQRIQTVYLLVVVALHVGLYYVNFWEAEHEGIGPVIELTAGDVITHGSSAGAAEPLLNWALRLAILNGIILLFTLITIFLYKRRMTQLRITRFLLLAEVLLLVAMFYVVEQAKDILPPTDEMEFGFGIGFPILAMILIFLAGRGIRHDEKLVRSADRLR